MDEAELILTIDADDHENQAGRLLARAAAMRDSGAAEIASMS